MPDRLRLLAVVVALSVLARPMGGAANEEGAVSELGSGSGSRSAPLIPATGTVTVRLDFAELLRLGRPASTIIIGGPEILDATVNGARTVVLTGKAVGTTNLIILDESGREISSLLVQVVAREPPVVTVHHGTERQNFSCRGPCEPMRERDEPSSAAGGGLSEADPQQAR